MRSRGSSGEYINYAVKLINFINFSADIFIFSDKLLTKDGSNSVQIDINKMWTG